MLMGTIDQYHFLSVTLTSAEAHKVSRKHKSVGFDFHVLSYFPTGQDKTGSAYEVFSDATFDFEQDIYNAGK